MLLTEGDLTWPTAESIGSMPQLSADLVALAQSAAVEWLWALSGRQYGTRPALYRPQARWLGACPPNWLQPVSGPLYGAPWPYSGAQGCDSRVVDARAMELPGPVVDDGTVTVDIYDATGTHSALDGAAVRVDGDWLVRQDGLLLPDSQDMLAALSSPNTWSVTYPRGVPVPAMGQIAAALVAAEFGKRFANDTKCKIPMNAVTVTRGGVTINRNVLKAAATTGVAEADQWINVVNPNGLQSDPVVWSPDVARNAAPYRGSAQFYS